MNMADLEDLDDDDEYASVYEDLNDAVSRFGPIKQIVIPRNKNLIKEPEEKKEPVRIDMNLTNPHSQALVALGPGSDLSFQQRILTIT